MQSKSMNRIYHILFFVLVFLGFFLISICQTFAQETGKVYLDPINNHASQNLLNKRVNGPLSGYYMIQFGSLPDLQSHTLLKSGKIELLQYVTDNTWIVFIKKCRVEDLQRYNIAYVGEYTSQHKLQQDLLSAAKVQDVKVQVFDTLSAPRYFTMHTLKFKYHGNNTFKLLNVQTADLKSIAEQDFVYFIGKDEVPE